jgi:mono/diheme cytochrome c family protein
MSRKVVGGTLSVVLVGTLAVGLLVPQPSFAQAFSRGDTDGNGNVVITDAIVILNFLFASGADPVCSPAADTNADANVNISDPIFLLGVLFLGTGSLSPLTQNDVVICKGLDPAAVERGMEIYQNPDPNGNLFACVTCHSLSPAAEEEILRPGHTLLNSLGRPSFKQGGRADYLGATNVCRIDWMLSDPWTQGEPKFDDLVQFIQSVSTEDTAPALTYELACPSKTGPSTGDADAGCRLFDRSCFTCHGKGGEGTFLGQSLLILTSPDLDNPDFIRSRIRVSGPNGPESPYKDPQGCQLLGTVMPFWTTDLLSDAQVEDLVAYVLAARNAKRQGGTFECDDGPVDGGNVVRSGTIVGKAHGVAGIVEELDTRKIRIREFDYDGNGIKVQVWLYKQDAIEQGVAIGPDLFGHPRTDDTLVVEIPAEITADMYDHVSIWCVTAHADFGSAALAASP